MVLIMSILHKVTIKLKEKHWKSLEMVHYQALRLAVGDYVKVTPSTSDVKGLPQGSEHRTPQHLLS